MKSYRAIVALAVTVVLWAVAFPAIRVGVHQYGPAALSLLRLAVASAVLAIAAPLVGVRRPARRDLPLITLAAIAGVAGYQFLLNWGEVHVPAGTASLIVVSNPVYSAILAVIFIGERMSPRKIVGVGVALGGSVSIAAARGTLGFDRSAWAIVGAAFAFGAYHVIIKPLLRRYSGLEVTAYATWIGTVLLLPALPALIRAMPHASAGGAVAAGFLGLAPSALGYVAWGYAIGRLPVTTATSSLYLVPPIAVVVGYLWLGETPRIAELVGGTVAIAGVAFANSRRSATRTARAEVLVERRT